MKGSHFQGGGDGTQKIQFRLVPQKSPQRLVWRAYQDMISCLYNFSVPPTWAEIQAAQVAEAHQVEDIPNAEVRDWSHPTMEGGMKT